jgi:hypothetical protein
MPKILAIVSKITNRTSLVQGHEYEVIGFDDSFYRVIDEANEPAFYPKSYFIDDGFTTPLNWVYRDLGEGEFSCDTPELSSPGFYENYADGEPSTIKAYKELLKIKGSQH